VIASQTPLMNQKMSDLPSNSKELLQAIKLQQKRINLRVAKISRLSKTAYTALYSKKIQHQTVSNLI
jgi:hypothetical protein